MKPHENINLVLYTASIDVRIVIGYLSLLESLAFQNIHRFLVNRSFVKQSSHDWSSTVMQAPRATSAANRWSLL